MIEGQEIDKKSILFFKEPIRNTDWAELAKDCVSFANANGGKILIGIEDDATLPHKGQKIKKDYIEAIFLKVSQLTMNVSLIPSIQIAENGGEYLEVKVNRNVQTVACTTDGRYYMRISDQCKPILADEIVRLTADRNAYVWEEQTNRKVARTNIDLEKSKTFLSQIRKSPRITTFVKEKSDEELFDHYFFTKNGYLTNLGILWIGHRKDRAMLLHAPLVQFIKYDGNDRKVNKIRWDDYSLNPFELLEVIQNNIPDWKEGIEISDGLYRQIIPNYDMKVIRELIINALVHRIYNMRGDIFINLYTDHLEIHNPGLLPLGVTPQNIISQSIRRNRQLAQVFYDLGLMESEGSGYDLMYEVLLSNGKGIPQVLEQDDRVIVSVSRRILKEEIIQLVQKANEEYQLRQKEIICLGLIAQHNILSALELSTLLNIKEANGVRHWMGRLLDLELIKSSGKTKATGYFVNPNYLKRLNFKGKTTLKKIEPHRLRELIIQDLKIYQPSEINNIHERIGKEISIRRVRQMIDTMLKDGTLYKQNDKRWAKYSIDKMM